MMKVVLMDFKKTLQNMRDGAAEFPNSKKRIMMALFGLVMLVGVAFSGLWGWLLPDMVPRHNGLWGSPLTECAWAEPDQTWLSLSMIAIMVNLFFFAFAYMLAGVFGPRVYAWTKGGIYNLLVSAIIVTIIFAAQQSMYGTGMDQIAEAQFNVQIIRDTMIAEDLMMVSATAVLSLVGNITPYLRPAGIIGISFSLQPAFRPIFDGLGITISMLSVAVGEWFVHEFLLCFAKTRMLSFFLPLGLFLRAYGLTERAGNVLIALAIGFFFVYPFMINVTAYSIEQYFGGNYQMRGVDGMTDVLKSSCMSASEVFWKPCYFPSIVGDAVKATIQRVTMSTDAAGGALVTYGIIQFITGSHPASLIIEASIFLVIAIFKSSVFFIVVVSIILPMFNLFITFTVIKELAATLGTEIDLGALEKLI